MNVQFRSCTVADSTQTLDTSSTASPQQNFQSWTESVPIAKSYDRNKLTLFSLLENAPKNRDFCLGSFSAVSTNFSILSSLSVRIRPHLAPETQNFRSIDETTMKNLNSKSEKTESNVRRFWRRFSGICPILTPNQRISTGNDPDFSPFTAGLL